MLRELIDIALLEDFASGLSRSAGRRICIYDSRGAMLAAGPASSEFTRLTSWSLGQLPPDMQMVAVPAHDPPAQVADLVLQKWREHGPAELVCV